MLATNTGRLGATVQSWNEDNPRATLKKLIERHPRETKESIYGRFSEETADDENAIEAMRRYWFENNFRRLKTPPNSGKTGAASEELRALIKSRATKMVLLDITLPTGTALRDSTAADCRRAGGWLAAVAKLVGPKKKVGEALSEADLQKIWKAAKR